MCRWSILILHNLKNGVSAVTVNGLPAMMRGDAGQQWQLDPESMQRTGDTVIKQVCYPVPCNTAGDAPSQFEPVSCMFVSCFACGQTAAV